MLIWSNCSIRMWSNHPMKTCQLSTMSSGWGGECNHKHDNNNEVSPDFWDTLHFCSKIRSNLVDNWSNKFLLEFWKNKKLISKFNWWTLSELIKVVWKVLKIGQKIFFSCYFNISDINQCCNGVSFYAVITKREHSVVVAPNCA